MRLIDKVFKRQPKLIPTPITVTPDNDIKQLLQLEREVAKQASLSEFWKPPMMQVRFMVIPSKGVFAQTTFTVYRQDGGFMLNYFSPAGTEYIQCTDQADVIRIIKFITGR